MEKNIESHELYKKQPQDFFGSRKKEGLGVMKRAEFKKTGSRTILLGGELAGKVIMRIVSKDAFANWSRAYEAVDVWRKAGFDYIPVEPIMKKDGELRAHQIQDGKYRVFAGVLGNNLLNFLKNEGYERKFGQELEWQRRKIIDVLEKKLGILHRHPHEANFCVEMINGKPRLYIIDFDQAVDIRPDDES